MEMKQIFYAPDRESWRGWLSEHGSRESEVWLVYYKAKTGQPTISYNDSLEEALCFGWVDSLIQKIDEEKYARKFTPRRPGSHWSEVNKHLAARLAKEGRMTGAGLEKMDFPPEEASAARPRRPELPTPDWMEAGLKSSPTAWENYSQLPPSQQRLFILWLSDAKKEATRQRRILQAIEKLERNERLGI